MFSNVHKFLTKELYLRYLFYHKMPNCIFQQYYVLPTILTILSHPHTF
nr:MAG TPA: hypothetical protein [Caudoviricetes sp.]